MSIPYLISRAIYIYLLLYAYAHDTVLMHVYHLDLLIYVWLSSYATWHSYHHSSGSSDSPDPHVQVSELGACGFYQLLT